MALKAGYVGIKKLSEQLNLTTEGTLSLNMENDPDAGGSLPISGDAAKILAERDAATRQLIDDTVGWLSCNLFDKSKLESTQYVSVEQTANGFKLKLNGTITYTSTYVTIYGDFDNTKIYLKGSFSNSGSSKAGFSIRPYNADGTEISNNRLDVFASPINTSKVMPNGTKSLRVYVYGSYDVAGAVNDVITFEDVIISKYDIDYAPYHASVEECKCDNTVIAPVEDGSTASQAYSTNDFFMHLGELYIATTSIAQGATFTVGTNCTKKTVGEMLTSILTILADHDTRITALENT